jgi:hypothetical protein
MEVDWAGRLPGIPLVLMIMTLAAGVAARLMVKRVSGAALPLGRGLQAMAMSSMGSVGTASSWVTPPRSLPPARHGAAGWKIWNATWWAGRIIGPAAAGVLTVIILGRAVAAISRRHAE